MNWDDLKFVKAIAKEGSLGKAARLLGSTQPTTGRRLDAFEREIGVKLFERTTNGLTPTTLGLALIEHLEKMEESALAVERRIAARDSGFQGVIIVSSLDWLSDEVIAPVAAAFCLEHPSVTIELSGEGKVSNLSRREADIAIRFRDFGQENVVFRQIAEVSYGLYASKTYLRRRGLPNFEIGAEGHDIVNLHRDAGRQIPDWTHSVMPRARTILYNSGYHAHLATVEAGLCIAALPRYIADRRPTLQRIESPLAEPIVPVRLGVHADMRDVPRIRAFIDYTVRALKDKASALAPPADCFTA